MKHLIDTSIYIYQLPEKSQNKIRYAVEDSLRGVVTSDRFYQEVNIVLSGKVQDLQYLINIDDILGG